MCQWFDSSQLRSVPIFEFGGCAELRVGIILEAFFESPHLQLKVILRKRSSISFTIITRHLTANFLLPTFVTRIGQLRKNTFLPRNFVRFILWLASDANLRYAQNVEY